MARAVAEFVAIWIAISIPAGLFCGRVMARAANLAFVVQPVSRRNA
jgi:hypothetical protein